MSQSFQKKIKLRGNEVIHEMAEKARKRREADQLSASNERRLKNLEKSAASEERCPGVSRSITYSKLFSATDEYLLIER